MYFKLKRVIDFITSIILFVLFSPIFLITLLLLIFANKGKPFFIQQRPGHMEEPFNLIKFKTMTDKKGSDGKLLSDEKRLTAIGMFIRKTSLDELPQLINIIKGDMSLIGPRPWLMEYLPLYSDYQKRRHEVKPGITGWAQVNGRNMLGWDDRFKYDVYYVENISFRLDLKIFFLTIWSVLAAKGVSSENEITMTKFKGNG